MRRTGPCPPAPTAAAGFTLAEMLLVATIAGILMLIAAPSVSRLGTDARVGNAAATVAADLEYARSAAAQLNVPVRIGYDADTGTYSFTNRVSGAVLVSRAVSGAASDYDLSTFTFVPTGGAATVDVYPNGLASSGLTLTLGAGSYTRTIAMTRAGLISVSSP